MRTMLAVSTLLLLAIGCGKDHRRGGATVDIRGDSAEEAADETTEAVCEWLARCGEPSIECGGSSGDDPTCTATIEDVSFADCYDATHPQALSNFRCVELTEDQAALVNDCINGLVSQDCVTTAEFEAYAAELEAGGEPEYPLETPPECEVLEEVFAGCPEA